MTHSVIDRPNRRIHEENPFGSLSSLLAPTASVLAMYRFFIILFALLASTTRADLPLGQHLGELFELEKKLLALEEAPFEPVRLNGSDNHYFLFVSGQFGNSIPRLFSPIIDQLMASGVPKKNLLAIRPDSGLSVQENVALIAKKIAQFLKSVPKDAWVTSISHSRGARELWEACVTSEFDLSRIDRPIFVQGAFQGTPLADLILEGGSIAKLGLTPYDLYRALTVWLTERPLHLRHVRDGLSELTVAHSQQRLSQLVSDSSERYQVLAQKAVYVRTYQEAFSGWDPSNLFYSGCVSRLHALGAPSSDGILPLESQAPPDVREASVLTLAGYHHGSLVMGRRNGAAFGRAILQFISGP